MKSLVPRLSGFALFASLSLGVLLSRATAPAGRYTIPGDGTVHDTKTNLVWQQAVSSQQMTQSVASTNCINQSLSGTGWRMPTMKELMTIVDFTATAAPYVDGNAFPGTPSAYFWSSSAFPAASGDGWQVDFSSGQSGPTATTINGYVRCVRMGP